MTNMNTGKKEKMRIYEENVIMVRLSLAFVAEEEDGNGAGAAV